MNIDDQYYLIFDKFANKSHSFTNPETTDYTIKYIFNSHACGHLNNVIYHKNKNAIDYFNKYIADTIVPKMQSYDQINNDIITIHLFNFLNNNNTDTTITIISIDVKKINKYFEDNQSVPNEELIKLLQEKIKDLYQIQCLHILDP